MTIDDNFERNEKEGSSGFGNYLDYSLGLFLRLLDFALLGASGLVAMLMKRSNLFASLD
jgi:hypothetical protein